jgi:hypothetical protein
MEYVIEFIDAEVSLSTTKELMIGDTVSYTKDYGDHCNLYGKVTERELHHYTDGEECRTTFFMYVTVEND